MAKTYNLVFIPISVYGGMAGGKRLNNIYTYLPKPDFKISNYFFEGGTLKRMWKSLNLIFYLVNNRSYRRHNVIYHYSNLDIYTLGPCIIGKLIGYKIIIDLVEDFSSHSKEWLTLKDKIRIRIQLFFIKFYPSLIDGYVAISRHIEKLVVDIDKRKPCLNLPVSFNPSDFSDNKKSLENPGLFKIFYGGSFGSKEGLEFLLPAFDKFATIYPETVLITTGKSSKRYNDLYKGIKNTLANKAKVCDQGYVEENEYYDLIQQSDVLCMTRNDSKFSNAGFPFKLASFLASGNPVIVTNVSNVADYLSSESCYFIHSNSSEEIFDALCSIKNDKTLAMKKGRRGKIVAYEQFNAQHHISSFVSFLDSVTAR